MTEEKAVTISPMQDDLSIYGADLNGQTMLKIKSFAPWANDPKCPMTAAEFSLALRRAAAMGVDPFNPHEVQIWKDKRGNVNFQLGYPLMVEWVREYKGEHTQPQYRELTPEEKEEAGLVAGHHAYECRFLMVEDIPRLTALIEAGYSPADARRMLEKAGVGVASQGEWSEQYFAPNGRSKAWKVQKRALMDAYRLTFGVPGPVEIAELRRKRGDAVTTPDTVTLSPGERYNLKRMEEVDAEHREEWEQLTEGEQQARAADNSKALYGDPDFEGFGDEPATSATPPPAWDEATFEAGEDDGPENDQHELTAAQQAEQISTLFVALNAKCPGFYADADAMLATIRLEYDNPDWEWPTSVDRAIWNGLYETAKVAAQKALGDAEQAGLPL